ISGITASGENAAAFTKLGEDLDSQAYFRLVGFGTDVQTWEYNNTWTKTGLLANTTYSYWCKATNAEGVETALYGPEGKATKIEPVESVEYVVGSSSIGVKANAVGGSYSNLSKGGSGVYYAICTDSYSFNNGSKSSWTWVQNTDTFYFTECPDGAALTRDTTYYFITNSRNFNALCNSTTTVETKWTLAAVPGTPMVNPKSEGGETRIQFTRTADDNLDYPDYAVAVSSDNFVSMTKFVDGDNPSYLIDTEFWQQKYLWGTDEIVKGLQPNTTYWIKIKARNQAGNETAYSAAAATVTFANKPWDVEIGSHNVHGLDRLGVTWSGDGTQYFVECSTASNYSVIKSSSEWLSISSWTVTGLDKGKKYHVRVKAANRVGKETAWSSSYWNASDYDYNFTLSTYPVFVSFSEVEELETRITWGYNGNPERSDLKYYIEWSTAGYGGVQWKSYGNSDWGSTDTHKAGGNEDLERDAVYYFRGKSKVGDTTVGFVESGWNNLGEKCTLIEAPGAVTVSEILLTQLTLETTLAKSEGKIGSGSDEGNDPNDDGVYFYEKDGSFTASGWKDSSLTWQTANTLSKNAQYSVRVKARNSEGVESVNPSTYTVCTAIDNVDDVETSGILITTVTARLKHVDGSIFTNLSSSCSAVKMKVFNVASYDWSYGDASAVFYTSWTQDNNWREVTGLTANTTYYFYGNGRNQLQNENTAYGPKLIVTKCKVPGATTLDKETTNQIRIKITNTTT
ncbi:MAG: fibronectin type III domain-containing protein, partial [Deltaproteobacteria bacterium]|nr:fibronectin type III domain-containing protein [Deltaproteobacteria bacterium]